MIGEYIWMLAYPVGLICLGAIACVVGYWITYGVISALAWIEDEIERAERARRRRARMRERARLYRAGMLDR